jgi:hypothetical protein
MSDQIEKLRFGPIVLFGSGETSPAGQKVFDQVLRELPECPRVALVETPAGFELNSPQVIGRVADFLAHRLQNYRPRLSIVAARARGTPFSPDSPEVVEAIFDADLLFMGPGSPSYAVRQLSYSLAWHAILARHRLGAALVLASAATVAASTHALPVYEIYKVGEDLHWKPGLDLFGLYGLPLVFIPHWNNTDGGSELDTSRCFMGKPRFARLMEMLPPDLTVMGIDEKTALIMDLQQGLCRVVGQGGVTLIHTGQNHPGASSLDALQGSGLDEVAAHRGGHVHQYQNGESFALSKLGSLHLPEAGEGIPERIWRQAQQSAHKAPQAAADAPLPEVQALVEARQAARKRKEWAESDRLRDQIQALGWMVKDTKDGPVVSKVE